MDKEDFEWLSQWDWHISSCGYARRQENKKPIYMHRVVNKTPDGLLTDHINRDTLDNRKKNLRIGDKSLNSINRGLQPNNTSGHKGVYFAAKKFRAYLNLKNKRIHLGCFININDAIFARKEAERKYHAI